VAPVEKKKRFFLKKKVEVAPEEILENSRQERYGHYGVVLYIVEPV
jgi:hypothetical protein